MISRLTGCSGYNVSGPGREGRSFLLCGFYAAPGGELDTWSWIIKIFHEVRKKFPGCSIVLAGDANVHLRSVVQHKPSCACVHCKQSRLMLRLKQ